MIAPFLGCWAKKHCSNVLMVDYLALYERMKLVGNPCGETTDVVGELDI